jgi:hypothetical protein
MGEQYHGDPEGRRLAKKRASLLSEAGYLVRALEVLLVRANYNSDQIKSISETIKQKELIELQRSYGRVQSRKKLKNKSGHPLLEGRATNCLFIDEAGKSSPEPHLQKSYFSLAGIAIDQEDIDNYIVAADELKLHFFKCKDFSFHEPKMRRFQGKYYFEGDKIKQKVFDQALDELIKNTKFSVFGAGIRKHGFEKDFVLSGVDPYLPTDAYMLAITLLIERYIDYLGYRQNSRRMGHITFESIGPKEDAYHQLEYARLLLEGSQWIPNSTFMDWLLPGLNFKPKAGSHPLELSDMFARDLYEWIANDCNVEPKRWHLFSQKIYCRDDGTRGKFGVKVFPDSDIRDKIDVHRILYRN